MTSSAWLALGLGAVLAGLAVFLIVYSVLEGRPSPRTPGPSTDHAGGWLRRLTGRSGTGKGQFHVDLTALVHSVGSGTPRREPRFWLDGVEYACLETTWSSGGQLDLHLCRLDSIPPVQGTIAHGDEHDVPPSNKGSSS